MKEPRSEDTRKFIVYVLLVTCVMLLLFEFIILPRYFKLSRDLALMGFAAEPNIVLDDTSINSMGFTGDVIDYTKAPGTVRVLTLGGSAFFNRRMTERLKTSLNTVSERPVEILGAALRTNTSRSSLMKYSALAKYKFDYVLIYHGINDLFVNHVNDQYFEKDYSHMVPWYKRNIILDNSLVVRIIYNNFIWGRKIFGGKKVWYIYPSKSSENKMGFISEKFFRRNITELIGEIKKNGAIPVIMTFAWNIPDNYSLEAFNTNSVGYNNPTNYDRYPVELWGSVKYVREGLQRHNRVLRQVAEQNDVFLLDQENLIGKDLYWFGDVCHLSEEGTEKFIDNITKFFIERRVFNMAFIY